MQITRIVKKNDQTVTVHLDNGDKLYLAYEVFLKNGLRKDMEISESLFSSLIGQNRKHYVKVKAYAFLGRRLHSEFELKLKLRKKGYEREFIEEAINELKESGYIDDRRFALLYGEENMKNKKWGRIRIKGELLKRGVNCGITEDVIEDLFSEEVEMENIIALARKKLRILSGRKYDKIKIKQKLMQFLITRGYNINLSRKAADLLLGEDQIFINE